MGARQDYLSTLILKNYTHFTHEKLSKLELEKSQYFNIVKEMYLKLGGQLSETPIKFGAWDISTKDFVIEFDEERHFNRYRKITLSSELYLQHDLFNVADYRNYCVKHEGKCLSAAGWGKNWKNDSTEKMFAKSNIEKNLEHNGSSRWRQRAYYDFLKDVKSRVSGIPVIRLSIYDNIDPLLHVTNYLARIK